MELRHLRYFVAVAEEGAMARAAERLHLTQPSLSRQLRQLERDIGTSLFERTTRGTTLTAAGTALHRHALLVLRLADVTRDVARAPDHMARDFVNLGIPQGVPARQLMRALAEVEERLPDTAISITEASSAEQLKLIREGHLDLGIVREPPSGNLRAERLYDVPIGLAMRPGHGLADKPFCRLSDLDGLRVLAHGRRQVRSCTTGSSSPPTMPEWCRCGTSRSSRRARWSALRRRRPRRCCSSSTPHAGSCRTGRGCP